MCDQMLSQRVKAAAQSDLRRLAEEAGFRLARGKTYHCALHRDRSPSAHLYEERMHCFSCGRGFDVIDLAAIIVRGSTAEAIRWLGDRYGVFADSARKALPRQTAAVSINAELFRVGFCWQLERYLDLLKQAWALDESSVEPDLIFRLTRLFTQCQRWTAYQTVLFYRALRIKRPLFVSECVAEAEELQLIVATLIAYLDTKEEVAA